MRKFLGEILIDMEVCSDLEIKAALETMPAIGTGGVTGSIKFTRSYHAGQKRSRPTLSVCAGPVMVRWGGSGFTVMSTESRPAHPWGEVPVTRNFTTMGAPVVLAAVYTGWAAVGLLRPAAGVQA